MSSQDHEKSLYDRIGGEPKIAELVDRFYEKVIADSEIGFYFSHIPIDKLRHMQLEFFAMATGGPLLYSGRPLSEVHHPLAISRRELDRFTKHLIETLEEVGIEAQDVLEIVAKINLYADEITNEASYGD